MRIRAILCGSAVVCFAVPCLAQANPWNGSWKIDPATVKYDGPSFSVATDADGYTITRNGQAQPKTVCDGKPHTAADKAVVTCTKTASGYAIEVSNNGKHTNSITISLAADGKTMTRKNTVSPADGRSPYTNTMVDKRVSGGPGMSGAWKEISFKESQDNGVIVIEVKGDSIGFKETDNDKQVMLKLDGTPVKFGTGTMAVKQDGPHTLKVTYHGADGKVRRENTFELSADGKTLTETDKTSAPAVSTLSMKFHKM